MAGSPEPEIGHRRQYTSLVRYRRGQDNVERGESIGLDDQHALRVDLIEITHLSPMHELKGLEVGLVEGLGGAHGNWHPVARNFRIIPAGWRLLPHRLA